MPKHRSKAKPKKSNALLKMGSGTKDITVGTATKRVNAKRRKSRIDRAIAAAQGR